MEQGGYASSTVAAHLSQIRTVPVSGVLLGRVAGFRTTRRVSEQASHTTSPQRRQWCLRREKENSFSQHLHLVLALSGIQGGVAWMRTRDCCSP